MNWHTRSLQEIHELTGSGMHGLSTEQAERRLREQGPNELHQARRQPAFMMFINQFRDFMILILLAAAVIAGMVGHASDTIIILIIVLLNAILGFIQEYRAEKALEALKKLASPEATVLRDGERKIVKAEELVNGDLVILEAGDIIPADLRIAESFSLKVDESTLTGESVTVDKTEETLLEPGLAIGDRVNMLYKTTLVTNGRASGIVVATGMHTEIGMIAKLLEEKSTATPLQKRMADFGNKLAYIILFICAALFSIGIWRGEDMMTMLLYSISLAVATIPEALPSLITIALARGAHRLVKVNALIRKLPAVETLGSVTFICSDKTGTLTLNKMKVVEVLENESISTRIEGYSMLGLGMALNHDTHPDTENKWTGDPTEIALVEYASQIHPSIHIPELQNKFLRITEFPFDSDRKCMTTIHRLNDKFLIICKGAAEAIALRTENSGVQKQILQKANVLAEQGKRVIAYAHRILDQQPTEFTIEIIETGLSYSGMVAMTDPPRPGLKASIDECKMAGIIPVMITGDHPSTARAIAAETGILEEGSIVITGKAMSEMSPDEFIQQVEQIRVYARVSPEQKLNIIKALQKKNHFIAMTGDGVNDAPSLKAADIGVAMGINGTDVSKEASDMILLDDDFSTIVKAIREGRRIYDNIRKFVKYMMTCNGAELLTIVLAPVFGLPIPLLPIHILWINLVTDGLPGLALAGEKAEPGIMKRPPRPTTESLFSRGIGIHIIWVGILMAAVTLGTQAWAIHLSNAHWQTMVFTVLSFSQMGHVIAIRSDEQFIYHRGLFTNPALIIATLITFFLQLLIIYLPAANEIFKTQALSISELLICIGISAIVFHCVELEKWIRKCAKTRMSNKA